MTEIQPIADREAQQKKALKAFAPWKVWLAVLIGLGVTAYLFINGFSKNTPEEQAQIWETLSQPSWFWLAMAVLTLIVRDAGYSFRIRHLTDKALGWKASFYTIILWEFASAVTPSVVGGTAIAVFILNSEKIPFGRALAYVMLTAVLDNLFFVIGGGIIVLVYGQDIFPHLSFVDLKWVFWISYWLIAFYVLLMVYGLGRPIGIKKLLFKVTGLRFLKRFRKRAVRWGDEMVIASRELRGQGLGYWAKAFLSTMFVWLARYFILNCLICAFASTDLTSAQHMSTLSKQVVMWVAQLASPTPGAGGLAEVYFEKFFGTLVGGAAIATGIAFVWRFFTYYLYLVLGAIFLPRWLKRIFVMRAAADADDAMAKTSR